MSDDSTCHKDEETECSKDTKACSLIKTAGELSE